MTHYISGITQGCCNTSMKLATEDDGLCTYHNYFGYDLSAGYNLTVFSDVDYLIDIKDKLT